MDKVHSYDCKVEHSDLYTLELQCLLKDKCLILVIVQIVVHIVALSSSEGIYDSKN